MNMGCKDKRSGFFEGTVGGVCNFRTAYRDTSDHVYPPLVTAVRYTILYQLQHLASEALCLSIVVVSCVDGGAPYDINADSAS